jgi:hypothetical protein
MMMKKFLFLSVLNINCISDGNSEYFKYDKLDEKCGAHWGPYARFTMITATVSVLINQCLELAISFMSIEKNQEVIEKKLKK